MGALGSTNPFFNFNFHCAQFLNGLAKEKKKKHKIPFLPQILFGLQRLSSGVSAWSEGPCDVLNQLGV
jgi:hypothetical protein